ncbi:MAG: HlyD family efflux transporter periplasmic adaptor subunit [Prolixibacteraceae bacterium]|nr:HlyD family efflux transporter periplasmic adaptor subunit [Prolixibacteraceae bacterium]MBN2773712.1 HlyD family efflux transporter periplasmic adaptor subunit [Prolixibacteraceae bacterium]
MKNKVRYSIVFIILILFAVIVILVVPKIKNVFQKQVTNEIFVVVDRGQVVVTIEATGIVEAENEVIILSPASSIIKKINKEAGSRVSAGEVIMELDESQVESEIEKISDQLDVKRNSLEKSQLNNRSTLIDLDYNVDVKKLRITSLKSQLADEEQLLSVGGISPARVEETKQNITLAEKDLSMIIEKNDIRLKQLKADEEGLLMQIRIQEKQLEEMKSLMQKLKVTAPSDGIILSVSGKVGEKVSADRMLARMSDLTTFKIIGSIDEDYSDFIKTGNQVYAIIDNEKLGGRIGNITPVIENSKIQFNIHLDESNHPGLIANQNIKIQVIRSLRNNTLRVPSNDEFQPNNQQIVLVKDSERVVKKSVVFGIKGIEYQEVLSGLKEGDQVITTDLSKYFKEKSETSL